MCVSVLITPSLPSSCWPLYLFPPAFQPPVFFLWPWLSQQLPVSAPQFLPRALFAPPLCLTIPARANVFSPGPDLFLHHANASVLPLAPSTAETATEKSARSVPSLVHAIHPGQLHEFFLCAAPY